MCSECYKEPCDFRCPYANEQPSEIKYCSRCNREIETKFEKYLEIDNGITFCCRCMELPVSEVPEYIGAEIKNRGE